MIGGHGHVIPRPDGVRARCGGPAICSVCAKEQAQLKLKDAAKPEPNIEAIARKYGEKWLAGPHSPTRSIVAAFEAALTEYADALKEQK